MTLTSLPLSSEGTTSSSGGRPSGAVVATTPLDTDCLPLL